MRFLNLRAGRRPRSVIPGRFAAAVTRGRRPASGRPGSSGRAGTAAARSARPRERRNAGTSRR